MESRLKFVVVPLGSAGDVHPLIWLSNLLQDRGHEVIVIAQEFVRDMVEKAGLQVVAWGTKSEQESILRNPDIWHPRRAFDLIARCIPEWAAKTIPLIQQQIDPDRTIVLAGALAFGARICAERWQVPLLTVHVQPMVYMSIDQSPVMIAHGEWIPRAPRWARAAFFNIANWMVDRKLNPGLQAVRTQAGPSPGYIRGIMRHYWNSPDGVLSLFPEWFAEKAPDWPAQSVTTRFPLYDGDEQWADDDLESFVNHGAAPPMVITPGSANAFGHRFIHEAVDACTRIGRRAVIVTRFTELTRELPATAKTFEYVPFGRLFPRAAAVIHHGGIGTTAQCLAAGVPQFIMPLSHDQPDNAARVKRMGVGDYAYPASFRANRIAPRIQALIDSPTVKTACDNYRAKINQQMSVDSMGELIESLSRRALRNRQAGGACIATNS